MAGDISSSVVLTSFAARVCKKSRLLPCILCILVSMDAALEGNPATWPYVDRPKLARTLREFQGCHSSMNAPCSNGWLDGEREVYVYVYYIIYIDMRT